MVGLVRGLGDHWYGRKWSDKSVCVGEGHKADEVRRVEVKVGSGEVGIRGLGKKRAKD